MNRSEITFGGADKGHHKCYAEREGDWVVFRCPICHDFERRINMVTGKMKIICDTDNTNLHKGFYIKAGLDTGLYHPN